VAERVYLLAGSLMAACDIPAAQALRLACKIVELSTERERYRELAASFWRTPKEGTTNECD